jgi:hypothetical protein
MWKMTKNLKSTPGGESKDETTGTPQASRSTNVENPSISDTSVTTVGPKSLKVSQPTPNLQDVPNAVRLIQALAAKLKELVFWKKLILRDGQIVYALCFPVRKWEVDPVSKELKLR